MRYFAVLDSNKHSNLFWTGWAETGMVEDLGIESSPQMSSMIQASQLSQQSISARHCAALHGARSITTSKATSWGALRPCQRWPGVFRSHPGCGGWEPSWHISRLKLETSLNLLKHFNSSGICDARTSCNHPKRQWTSWPHVSFCWARSEQFRWLCWMCGSSSSLPHKHLASRRTIN